MNTYPPPVHIVRDLAPVIRVTEGEALTCHARLPLRPELAGSSGRVLAGPVAMVVDMVGGGLASRAAHPDWIATADLTLHLVTTPREGVVEMFGRVARKGRTTVVLDVDVRHDDTAIGAATMTFALLPRRDDNPDIAALVRDGHDRDSETGWLAGGALTQPFDDALGITVVDAAAGVLEAPVQEYTVNTLGAMQGGVVATLLCRAADAALTDACGAPVETADLQLTYLSLNRHGPIRTRTEVLHASPTHGSARVETVDANGRVTATAGIVACAPVEVPA